jgi:hypothetical protein
MIYLFEFHTKNISPEKGGRKHSFQKYKEGYYEFKIIEKVIDFIHQFETLQRRGNERKKR